MPDRGVQITEVRRQGSPPCTTVWVSGLMARGPQQIRPLEGVLPVGRIVTVHHGGPRFDHSGVVRAVVDQARRALDQDSKVLLVGASLGGMELPFVVAELLGWYDHSWLCERLRVIIIDAPNGANTMKELPGFAAPLLPLGLGRAIGSIATRIPKGPKDHEVSTPSPEVIRRLTGRLMDEADWKRYVNQAALEGLKGYPAPLFSTWVNWMIKVGRNGSLAAACSSLAGIDAHYLACVHPGNVTVAQPQAADWWRRHAPGLRVTKVNAVHCGFLQQQPEFAKALRSICAK